MTSVLLLATVRRVHRIWPRAIIRIDRMSTLEAAETYKDPPKRRVRVPAIAGMTQKKRAGTKR